MPCGGDATRATAKRDVERELVVNDAVATERRPRRRHEAGGRTSRFRGATRVPTCVTTVVSFWLIQALLKIILGVSDGATFRCQSVDVVCTRHVHQTMTHSSSTRAHSGGALTAPSCTTRASIASRWAELGAAADDSERDGGAVAVVVVVKSRAPRRPSSTAPPPPSPPPPRRSAVGIDGGSRTSPPFS